MKMPPSATRSATTAICRILFLEKSIDITAEQTVVAELGPGLLPELVGDHDRRGLGEFCLLAPLHFALHFGCDGRILGQCEHPLLLVRCQYGGHGFPVLAVEAPLLLVAE